MRIVIASAAADWLTAVGTLAAAGVALLGYWIVWWRNRQSRPRLTLTFDADESQTERNPITGHELPYVRLRVANAAGRHAGQGVQVLVLQATPQNDAPPIQFASAPLGWTGGGDPGDNSRLTIGPGVSRYVDLGCAMHPSVNAGHPPTSPLHQHALMLSLVTPPADLRHVLPVGTYRLRLALSGTNLDAHSIELDLGFSSWNTSEEFWDGFHASVVA